MLIKPQQTLPLARILSQLFIFKYNFQMYLTHSALRNHTKKKPMFHRFVSIQVNTVTTAGQSWPNYIGPKREKKIGLSNQSSVCSYSLKVAWSGISLIRSFIPATQDSRGAKTHCDRKCLGAPPVHDDPTWSKSNGLNHLALYSSQPSVSKSISHYIN